jgi:ATP-dependent Zn protease
MLLRSNGTLLFLITLQCLLLAVTRGFQPTSSTRRVMREPKQLQRRIREFPSTSASAPPLTLSMSIEKDQEQPPPNLIVRVLKRFLVLRMQLARKFIALPRRAKRIVLMNVLFLSCLCGGMARKLVAAKPVVRPIEIMYSDFLRLVESDNKNLGVNQVRIGTDKIVFRLSKEENSVAGFTRKVMDPNLVTTLQKHAVEFSAMAPQVNTAALAVRTFIMTFYCLILWRLYKSVSGGGMGKDSPGKLARTSELPLASFDDIQGIDNAKVEVMELVDTLRFPEKYAILGARAPTGLLLDGPPGTGKTLLARATAAAAGVPLLYCSGSDFVEVFVGRGAARVRKLFERAEKLSPCIIFIDELDALVRYCY